MSLFGTVAQAPDKAGGRAFRSVLEVIAPVPYQCSALIAQLRRKHLVILANIVAHLSNGFVHDMFLPVAQTQEHT